jgi:O-methyltransferase involved in polyketide biosynthesis
MQVANVPEILFKPVYFRAKETQRADSIIQDPIAVEILQKISPNLSDIDDWTIQFGIVIHTTIVDNVVKQFLQQHPNAVIITLGGGLATRPPQFGDRYPHLKSINSSVNLRQQYFINHRLITNSALLCFFFCPD